MNACVDALIVFLVGVRGVRLRAMGVMSQTRLDPWTRNPWCVHVHEADLP